MKIADNAHIIINGYAFTCEGESIRVLNLSNPSKAVVISKEGNVLETSMDDIEVRIVLDYYENNKEFLEVDNA